MFGTIEKNSMGANGKFRYSMAFRLDKSNIDYTIHCIWTQKLKFLTTQIRNLDYQNDIFFTQKQLILLSVSTGKYFIVCLIDLLQ